MKTVGKATDLITFSRSSGGTALRKISYGPELVTNGTFDTDTTGWTPSNGATLASVSNQLVVSQTTTDYVWGYQAVTCNVGKVYIVTVDITSVSGQLRVGSTSNGLDVTYFDGAGSYSHVFVATSSQVYLSAKNNTTENNTSSTFDNISVKEVLFDQGTLTLFNHPADVPRIEYDADGNVLGLLVEESRTNLLTYSEDFTDGYWTKGNTSTLAIDAIGPDGQTLAVTLVDSGATGSDQVYISKSITVATSTTYTVSMFAKEDQLSWLAIGLFNFTSVNGRVWFDLSTGVVGTEDAGITGNIQAFGNGWYRCSATFTSDVADTSGLITYQVCSADNTIDVDLDGTSSILIYGAQLEAGDFPTSYIPTAGATATRSADVASIPVADFGYNQSEGTVVVDYSSIASKNKISDFFIFNTNSSFNPESWGAYGEADGVSSLIGYRRSNSAYDTIASVASFDGDNGGRVAVSQSKSNVALSSTGLLDSNAISSSELSTITELDFANGAGVVGGKHSGHIKSIKYYPRRLTNAQLQELTT